MTTAVQLRSSHDCTARIVFGEPACVSAGRLGPIWLFGPARVVAYIVRANGRSRLFVFRTLAQPEELRTQVPGVQPAVRLLLVAHTSRRIYRARRLLREVEKLGASPDTLTDTFYLRAAATLSRRVSIEHLAMTLLLQQPIDQPRTASSSQRTIEA